MQATNKLSWSTWYSMFQNSLFNQLHRPVASHWQSLSHNVVTKYTSPWTGFKLTILVVIGTDCTGSCKSNYHTIMTTTTPHMLHGLGIWCLMPLSIIFQLYWWMKPEYPEKTINLPQVTDNDFGLLTDTKKHQIFWVTAATLDGGGEVNIYQKGDHPWIISTKFVLICGFR